MEINIFQDTAMKYPDFFIRLEAEQGISVKAVPDDGVEGFQIVK
jgi:hypothetical protein